MFIDTHSHLYDDKLKNDIENILLRARENKVEKIIVAGCDIPSCEDVIELSKKYPEIYVNIGIYPQYADNYNKNIENRLKELAKNEKVVGIGEIGLDFTYENVSREIQKETLLKQIKLAHELKLPIVLHGRDSYGELVNLLKENKELISYGGTFHCFTGSKELAKEIVKLGFYISVGGVSTFQNSVNVKEMIKTVPLENLILETDSPYLAPVPKRGKINEPSFIPFTAENLAELKGVSKEEIEEITTKNAKRLFNI